MKITKFILTGIILLSGIYSSRLYAQSDSLAAVEPPNKSKGGAQKFLLAGKAELSWTNTKVDGSPNSHTFYPDAFMLMPLVKLNNHLFLDAQVEVDANPTGGAAIKLNELIAYYRIHPLVNLFFGNFSPKYGLYMGVLDDFTNRYGSSPIGMGRGPQTQTGFGIQGGVQAGYSKFNYQFYISNGPQLITIDNINHYNYGQMNYGNYADNNTNKSIGGSIGFLPFSNSSLQIDVSGQYTAKTGDAGTAFENVSSTSWAADLNYYHVFNPIMVRVLAEYNNTQTQNATYFSDTSSTSAFTFNNSFSGWFIGSTIRASGSQSTFLSNLELGGRIGGYTAAKGALWEGNSMNGTPMNQTTVCLTYWFTWKTPLNIIYDVYTQAGNPTQKVLTVRTIFFF